MFNAAAVIRRSIRLSRFDPGEIRRRNTARGFDPRKYHAGASVSHPIGHFAREAQSGRRKGTPAGAGRGGGGGNGGGKSGSEVEDSGHRAGSWHGLPFRDIRVREQPPSITGSS